MEEKEVKYELMKITKEEVSSRFPNGFDEDSVTVGNGKEIVRWLLKNSENLKGLILSKKLKCNVCRSDIKNNNNYIKYRGKTFCVDCLKSLQHPIQHRIPKK